MILLLVSANYLASDYCYGIEMQRALQRHQDHEARVIPILLSSVDWKGAPFEHLQVLPSNAQPITGWSNLDDAFTDIAIGIRKTIQDLSFPSASALRTPLQSIQKIPYQPSSSVRTILLKTLLVLSIIAFLIGVFIGIMSLTFQSGSTGITMTNGNTNTISHGNTSAIKNSNGNVINTCDTCQVNDNSNK